MINQSRISIAIIVLLIFNACATYKPQYKNKNFETKIPEKELAHSFYFIGDAGNSPSGSSSEALVAFKKELSKASEQSTAVFLGDNIYESGLPKKSDEDYELAKHRLNAQIEAAKDFPGESIFIPGNHDWYSGVNALKRQEEFVEEALGKNTFLPENGCPIRKVEVSRDIDLIVVDSYWYIANWDRHPTINDDCDIKTRAAFLDEFGSLIKKARGKTTIVAIHHPMFTNGSHGGQYSFGSHMRPLPVLGTLKNIIRKTSGVANVDTQNVRYSELRKNLVTLAQQNAKLIFVSGHEHNLQHIISDNLHQIVSGTGSKTDAVRNIGGGQFAYASPGYAVLDVYRDGSSNLRFHSTEETDVVYRTEIFKPNDKKSFTTYPKSFPKEKSASIYSEDETDKSGFHNWLWGERYRKYYSTKVNAPTVDLDTLFGGLSVVRKGGGNQSKSLRLKDKNGTQYVMRALRKQATQYLQATIFRDQYIEGQFEDTAVEDLILDVFAGAHPYAPFVVGPLSDAVGVYHTNPVLYFIPKQNALGSYNTEFGDELYMIEEHTSEGHGDKASFGFQDKLLSTDEMRKKIQKDEELVIDEASYIRARLFDMLIGDWDRHPDQWRWIEFKENGKKVYRPMPRDRDQAFSIMADGAVLGTAVKFIPTARLLRKYDDDLVDVRGVNLEPYPLDMELIQQSNKNVWDAQVKILQDGITDEVIEEAFMSLPVEVRDETTEEIKRTLRARRSNLQKISDRYYTQMNDFVIIKGTNKDDWFDIERMPNGQTKITGYRIKDDKKADIFLERSYKRDHTNEIWIYALDDDDTFHVYGEGDNLIKLRLIGGQNNDTYDVKNGKRVTYYDYKSKKNTILAKGGNKKFTDDYQTNVYDYKKLKNITYEIVPVIGSNPDDGLKIGINGSWTNNNFERNPFSNSHKLSAAYYFATQGYDLNYQGEFANILQGINFGFDAHFNSPNYAVNFFGFGSETPNFEADEDDGIDVNLDFNRVKIRTFKVMPSLIWRGDLGGSLKLGVSYESNEVQRTENRFIESLPMNNSVFDKQDFYGADLNYHFENKDNKAFPTLGMQVALQLGYKNNVATNKGFGYVAPEIGFDYRLEPTGNLVLATDLRAHLNLGDDFEFYQGATLGANNGLRGYRNQRFTGKTAFVQSTDLRLNLRKLKTGFLPIQIGIYGGLDYGRVWVENDTSDKWNNSFGGGLFMTMASKMTGNISAFNSDDGLRLAFRLGFGF